jgi:hypothetical protein
LQVTLACLLLLDASALLFALEADDAVCHLRAWTTVGFAWLPALLFRYPRLLFFAD